MFSVICCLKVHAAMHMVFSSMGGRNYSNPAININVIRKENGHIRDQVIRGRIFLLSGVEKDFFLHRHCPLEIDVTDTV